MKNSKEPLSWTDKCQVAQTFLDTQEVITLRQRSGIGWFGRVKEFFLGSSLSNKQALDFQQFIQDLKLFDIDNVEKSNFFEENDKKKGFGFNQDIFNQE